MLLKSIFLDIEDNTEGSLDKEDNITASWIFLSLLNWNHFSMKDLLRSGLLIQVKLIILT